MIRRISKSVLGPVRRFRSTVTVAVSAARATLVAPLRRRTRTRGSTARHLAIVRVLGIGLLLSAEVAATGRRLLYGQASGGSRAGQVCEDVGSHATNRRDRPSHDPCHAYGRHRSTASRRYLAIE